MDIKALKSELDSGHPESGNYSANSVSAAGQLNTKDRSKLVPISSSELLAWAAQSSRIVNIRNAATAHVSTEVQSVAIAADIMVTRDGTSLDLSLADRMAMIDALVAGGVLTAADKTSLVTLATKSISRAEELGFGKVTPGAVLEARNL